MSPSWSTAPQRKTSTFVVSRYRLHRVLSRDQNTISKYYNEVTIDGQTGFCDAGILHGQRAVGMGRRISPYHGIGAITGVPAVARRQQTACGNHWSQPRRRLERGSGRRRTRDPIFGWSPPFWRGRFRPPEFAFVTVLGFVKLDPNVIRYRESGNVLLTLQNALDPTQQPKR